jgi:uncharacterized membrane protein YcfT
MPWVDTAKGISIILVVMMYAAYNTGEHTGGIGFLHYVIGFATPFRMPEFFLISGLFLSQVIARPWRRYADRRIVHYLYFYALWAAISIGLKIGLFSRAPGQMLHDLALAVVEPYGVLWFIYMLAVFSLAAKLLWQWRVPHWVVVPLAAVLQMTAYVSPSYIVTQFCAYFVFFYLGYAASPLVFRLVALAERHKRAAVAGLVVWALAEGLLVFSPGYALHPMDMQMGLAAWPPLHLALAVIGALALCVMGALLAELPWMDWLRWLGEHSLVVYVAFTIPMSIVRGILLWSGLVTDTGMLSLVVLVASTASPVILYLIVKRIGLGTFLFERPRWAHVPEKRPEGAPEPLPAAE